MKSDICYCSVDGTHGMVRNRDNTAGAPPPELVMGLPCELRLRLFANCADTTPYPMEQLAGVVGWSFAMDTDFSPLSTVKLIAENTDIQLAEVTENGVVYTQLTIPIPETHTTELAAALDGKESIPLDGELIGYDSEHEETFVLQIRGFVVRGRLTGLGDSLSVLSAVCGYLSEEAVSSVLDSGGYVVSSGAAAIASGAAVEVLSGGALPKDKPFSTTVGGYTIELTSNGGFSVYGSGASVTLSNGSVNVSAAETIEAQYYNAEYGASAGMSIGYGGAGLRHSGGDGSASVDVHGGLVEVFGDISGFNGLTVDGSAITQVTSEFDGTSLGIGTLEGGVRYVCASALSALSIDSAAAGCYGTFYFTAASAAIVNPPANVPYFGVTSYTPGSSYLMMVNGDAAVCNEAAIVPGV